jgi:hypothetical protein
VAERFNRTLKEQVIYQPVAKVPIFRNPASSCQQQRPMLCKVLFRTK